MLLRQISRYRGVIFGSLVRKSWLAVGVPIRARGPWSLLEGRFHIS